MQRPKVRQCKVYGLACLGRRFGCLGAIVFGYGHNSLFLRLIATVDSHG